MDSLERIYSLHQILRDRRHPVSTSALMDELECSRSTLHRTRDHLRDVLRAPILNVPGRGYFYDRSAGEFELPGLWFRAEELEALLVMDHLIERVQPGLLQPYLKPIRHKLKGLLDTGTRGRRRFPAHRIRILPVHARRVTTTQLVQAATAVIERRQISFSYAGRAAGTITQRTASPQRLVYYRDQWYADCHDEDKQAVRTFSVDRMRDIKVLDRRSRDIDDDELDELLSTGYGLFAGPAKHKARLIFTPERARWVADEEWHPDQVGQFRMDGSYELTIPYSDPRELMGEILRHGPEVRVTGPKRLVEHVRDHLERAAAQYAAEDSSRVSGFETRAPYI